jgi:hypothetical protein
MDAEALRKRAQHLRKLAALVADERTRQAALHLAAGCDHEADGLEHLDSNCVSSAQSSLPVQSAPASGPFVEPGDNPRTDNTAKHKYFLASSLRI